MPSGAARRHLSQPAHHRVAPRERLSVGRSQADCRAAASGLPCVSRPAVIAAIRAGRDCCAAPRVSQAGPSLRVAQQPGRRSYCIATRWRHEAPHHRGPAGSSRRRRPRNGGNTLSALSDVTDVCWRHGRGTRAGGSPFACRRLWREDCDASRERFRRRRLRVWQAR